MYVQEELLHHPGMSIFSDDGIGEAVSISKILKVFLSVIFHVMDKAF